MKEAQSKTKIPFLTYPMGKIFSAITIYETIEELVPTSSIRGSATWHDPSGEGNLVISNTTMTHVTFD